MSTKSLDMPVCVYSYVYVCACVRVCVVLQSIRLSKPDQPRFYLIELTVGVARFLFFFK